VPTATQFCIGLENKPGVLARLCGVLGQAGVNVDAVFVAHEEECSWVNLVANPTEVADRVLGEREYNYYTEQVLILRIDNHSGQLERIASTLANSGVNINYVYGGCVDDACDSPDSGSLGCLDCHPSSVSAPRRSCLAARDAGIGLVLSWPLQRPCRRLARAVA